ncbi:MAG TPA: cytochrome c oxidase assembly factor Coa1 family protein [Pyrinomonadaceae bacterium]|jgi:TonB family protein
MMNQNPAQFGGNFQQPQAPQQKGCWGRNWKWIVPVGCLGLILGGVALVLGIVAIAMSAIKSSDVYQGALKVAQTHPAAVERLGEPVKDGWFVKGNIKVDAAGGNADFEIPVSGPKRSGKLFVRAVNPDGAWMYERLELATDGGGTVSLLDRSVVQPPPPPGSSVDVEEDADGSASEDDAAIDEALADAPEGDDDAAAWADAVQGGLLDGKATSKPAPPYPPVAKAARASGTVIVRVLVDEQGHVVSASGVSGHPLLQAAAVAAAKQARFSPTVQGGRPVKVSGLLTYNFVLEQ